MVMLMMVMALEQAAAQRQASGATRAAPPLICV